MANMGGLILLLVPDCLEQTCVEDSTNLDTFLTCNSAATMQYSRCGFHCWFMLATIPTIPVKGFAAHDGRNGPRNRHEFRAFDM
jgi:hypothetical protein